MGDKKRVKQVETGERSRGRSQEEKPGGEEWRKGQRGGERGGQETAHCGDGTV